MRNLTDKQPIKDSRSCGGCVFRGTARRKDPQKGIFKYRMVRILHRNRVHTILSPVGSPLGAPFSLRAAWLDRPGPSARAQRGQGPETGLTCLDLVAYLFFLQQKWSAKSLCHVQSLTPLNGIRADSIKAVCQGRGTAIRPLGPLRVRPSVPSVHSGRGSVRARAKQK